MKCIELIAFPYRIFLILVHAMVYEPSTGEAKILPVDFGSYLVELRSVYDLYQMVDDIKS